MSAPSDVLAPVGWTCTRDDRDAVVFEHEEASNAVRAVRTAEDEDLWRVELFERAGEAESAYTVGYAATRDRALDALSTAMSAMNRVRDRTGPVHAMMASTLALHDDAGVRGGGIRDISPAWRTADRPFDSHLTTQTPREPWLHADAVAEADVDAENTDDET